MTLIRVEETVFTTYLPCLLKHAFGWEQEFARLREKEWECVCCFLEGAQQGHILHSSKSVLQRWFLKKKNFKFRHFQQSFLWSSSSFICLWNLKRICWICSLPDLKAPVRKNRLNARFVCEHLNHSKKVKQTTDDVYLHFKFSVQLKTFCCCRDILFEQT